MIVLNWTKLKKDVQKKSILFRIYIILFSHTNNSAVPRLSNVNDRTLET